MWPSFSITFPIVTKCSNKSDLEGREFTSAGVTEGCSPSWQPRLGGGDKRLAGHVASTLKQHRMEVSDMSAMKPRGTPQCRLPPARFHLLSVPNL